MPERRHVLPASGAVPVIAAGDGSAQEDLTGVVDCEDGLAL